MNHNFRSIWNAATGTFVASPETAMAAGGTTASVRRPSPAALALTPLAAALAMTFGSAMAAGPTASQLPTSGVVKAGNATLAANGSTLTVNQGSNRAVIDWNSFNVGTNATVNFVQPNPSAITLNRVIGNEGSVVNGALHANGQVFLLNPNGVLFGKNAKVDTGGLLAGTLGISDLDFMAGKSRFVAAGKQGSVVNLGSITAADGGYVALIGQRVSNQGVITARLGSVVLAAGDAITLNFGGNSLVDVTIDRGTYQALVENRQLIVADGGLVKLSASTADKLLDTVVNNTGTIQSQTVANQRGRIFLLGEGGRVEVAGTLDASAPTAGNGGFIETSGERVVVADGTRITTAASHGVTGKWLVDPTDFTVAASGGDMTGAELSSTLANTDVQLQSSQGSAAGSGNVNINDALNWNAHTLTLTAANDVNINAVMTATGAASLDLEPATANGTAVAAAGGRVNVGMDAAGNFIGKVNFAGGGALTINGQAYTVIQSLGANETDTAAGTLQGMQGDLAGYYVLGTDIDASATSAWNGGSGFSSIGTTGSGFTGVFNGLGHLISSLTLSRPSFSGLLSYTSGSVSNLGIVDASQSGYNYAGLLAGLNRGSIWNTFASGTQAVASNGGFAGMLVGSNYAGGMISHSVAAGTMNVGGGTNYVGGLVGLTTAAISDSHSSVSINLGSSVALVGGLAGGSSAQISKSSASGNITALDSADAVGGLVGQCDIGCTVVSSHASGSIKVGLYSGNVGGLVGYLNQSSGNLAISGSYATGAVIAGDGAYGIGGLVGTNTDGVVSTSFSTGAVAAGAVAFGVGGLVGNSESLGHTFYSNVYASGNVSSGDNSTAVGGLIGRNTGTAQDAYATGSVTAGAGSAYVGGLLGQATQSGGGDASIINRAYSTGLVVAGAGSSSVGGLIGGDSGVNSVTNSFWDTQNSAQATSAEGVGMTSAQMQSGLNFIAATSANGGVNPGWDLSGTWLVYEGHTAPLLRAFLAPLAISVNATKTYDGTVNGGAVNYSFVADPSLLFGTLDMAGAGRNVGTYTVAPTGLYSNQQGYAIHYVGGTLAVTPATLAVSALGGNQTYNGSTSASVTLSGNPISGDSVAFGYTSATMADKNVGSNKLTQVSGISISGADAGNYVLANRTATTTADVTPATLTVAATGGSQVYNGTTVAKVTLGSNAVAGDALTLADTSATLADKNVGSNKAVTVSGISISGADAANYVLAGTLALTTTNVTPATLIVRASALPQQLTHGTQVDVTLAANGVPGDQLTLSDASASVADVSVGAGKPVSVTGIAVSGADAGNYILASTTVSTTVDVLPTQTELRITPRPLPSVIASAIQTPFVRPATNIVGVSAPIPPAPRVPFSTDAGQALNVYATPAYRADDNVTLSALLAKLNIAPDQTLAVPVANLKFISLLNGGVKLPEGVQQQFFVNTETKK